jgi:hypothetical protein
LNQEKQQSKIAGFPLASGFTISGTPLTNVAVNPFPSALADYSLARTQLHQKSPNPTTIRNRRHRYRSSKTNTGFKATTTKANKKLAPFLF